MKRRCSAASLLVAFAMLLLPASALCLSYNGSSTIGEEYLPKLALAFYQETGVSRPLSADEKAKGLTVKTIGFDAVGVFVNKANPVKNLSTEQLKDIFTGRITRWNEVGGPPQPIEVVTEILTGNRATLKVFRELVLSGAPYHTTREIDSPHACVRYVSLNPNAITHASIRFAEPGIALVSVDGVAPTPENISSQKYRITRPLHLIHRAGPSDDLKKFMEFVSSAKGDAILKSYFSPVK